MIKFTAEEKAYIKKFVILDLEDRVGLKGNPVWEDKILDGIIKKLKALCDA